MTTGGCRRLEVGYYGDLESQRSLGLLKEKAEINGG